MNLNATQHRVFQDIDKEEFIGVLSQQPTIAATSNEDTYHSLRTIPVNNCPDKHAQTNMPRQTCPDKHAQTTLAAAKVSKERDDQTPV